MRAPSLRASGAATAGVAAALLATTGCVINQDPPGLPACDPPPSGLNSALVLMAQAVPTASQLPCIRALPVDWDFDGLRAKDGMASFQLVADRLHSREVVVETRQSCDVTGATELLSQQPGIQRFERLDAADAGHVGERYYVYDGGCTTYRFDLPDPTGAQMLDTLAQSLGFVSRETLRRQVHDRSDGRLELDPESPG